jgi:hypothetical protein
MKATPLGAPARLRMTTMHSLLVVVAYMVSPTSGAPIDPGSTHALLYTPGMQGEPAGSQDHQDPQDQYGKAREVHNATGGAVVSSASVQDADAAVSSSFVQDDAMVPKPSGQEGEDPEEALAFEPWSEELEPDGFTPREQVHIMDLSGSTAKHRDLLDYPRSWLHQCDKEAQAYEGASAATAGSSEADDWFGQQPDLVKSVFVRWGHTECPLGADEIYTGIMAGGNYKHSGDGANYVCLAQKSEFPKGADDRNNNGALLCAFTPGPAPHAHMPAPPNARSPTPARPTHARPPPPHLSRCPSLALALTRASTPPMPRTLPASTDGTEYEQTNAHKTQNINKDAACVVCQRSGAVQTYVQWG